MKLRADLKLVRQLDYMPVQQRDFSYCTGCVFQVTTVLEDSLCERVNAKGLTCSNDMIWVFEDDKTNFRMEKK